MNPLIPTNAIQLRYDSPRYEPYYDDDGNVVDEECVEYGTDIVETFIEPVLSDGIPRYYRLRYSNNAKDHKKRWSRWVRNSLGTSNPYFVRVSKVGRRVLFTYDPKLSVEHEKIKKKNQWTLKKVQEIERSSAASPAARPDEIFLDVRDIVSMTLAERQEHINAMEERINREYEER